MSNPKNTTPKKAEKGPKKRPAKLEHEEPDAGAGEAGEAMTAGELPGEPQGEAAAAPGKAHDAQETAQAKQARGLIRLCEDKLDRDTKRVRAFLDRAKAAPESSASSLDEAGTLLVAMGHYFLQRGAILRDGPGEPNRLLAVAARSVRNELLEAAATLDQSCHTPSSWKSAENRLAEASKTVKSAIVLLGTDGIAAVARDENPLLDESGKPLVNP